jgi:catechol 2,3-dioxygenase-like lactoylglutathione lyase family enzyme
MMTGHVEGLSHLLIQVSDMAAAEHFYCDLLGLQVRSRDTFGGSRPLVVTHQGLGITLLPAEPAALENRNVEHVAFWVRELDTLIEKLRAEGYPVEGPNPNSYGRGIYTLDPDGYRVECIERSTT